MVVSTKVIGGLKRKERDKMIERTGPRYHSAAAFVRDIEVSKKFYTEVLELAVELDLGKEGMMPPK
jgi:predicted enzyme related to lactoylglutathione lyase